MTIAITTHTEPLCTKCWDHCASMQDGAPGFPSMKLVGPGRVAVQGNCAGKFAYAGGWSDASTGGVFGEADGCHEGGGNMVILCSGTIKNIQDDLLEVCGTPLPAPALSGVKIPFSLLEPGKFSTQLGDDQAWAEAK